MLLSIFSIIIAGCEHVQSTDPTRPDAPSSPTTPVSLTRTSAKPVVSWIEMTPKAKEQLKSIAKSQNVDPWWLRVTIKPGGCSGMQHKLDLDYEGVQPGDTESFCDGIACLSTAKHDFLVQGIVIDYKQTEKETGFSIESPNKSKSSKDFKMDR